MKVWKGFAALLVPLLLATPAVAAERMITVGISQFVGHPALDAARRGFIDALKEHGYVEGKNITYDVQIALGSMANANTIARSLVARNVDLIHSISTPASRACVNATKTIPIVFSSVTDPVAARLVKTLDAPGGNVTGTTDQNPVDRQLALILELSPKTKKIGFIYNSWEDSSLAYLKQLRQRAGKRGIEVVEASVSNTSGVLMAAKGLVGKVDAIHIPKDNTVLSAFDWVVKVCQDNNIPLYTADIGSVARGAIAAVAMDYYRLGKQSGEMAYRILKGANPSTMPVETLKDVKLYVNTGVAKKMGVTLPPAVVKRADKVIAN
ncbi:MAG: ABC transporter permease [Syntrophobacteraceae bacterium CG2_30_61_12]|nr:MAG: ABC transporter permease [Syntrophobacteraceae bacterium CG2_30_61_12]PIU31303.1 MAG: ABC transporter permease [Syntrophobacteraceae bacterium CG07_land_8_20_14_0_80_61_8]